ncbi:unnamed protein product [Cylicocyclus nassatus]|uniref:CHK kinase-like domain-containing protein n=1 Tax=Cylicocyclus nassatus TaxID=53992 RepID=A0AA36H0J0_CYLNA|nr:unnamed protein product [Cylicocyclus nassatus]
MSRIAVIDPDYQEEMKDLPYKFAVKMVTILPSLGLAESVRERHELQIEDEKVIEGFEESARNLHNREVDVYRIFSRFDNSLSKMPHLYFTQNFTKENDVKGFIGMEFVEGVVTRNIFHNVRPEELSEAVRALAYLEAKSLELSDDEKQKVASNPIPIIYPDMIHATAVSNMFQDMYAAAPELEPAGKLLETMTADIVDLELTSTLNKELGMQDVFVHGDLWSANLMWTSAGDGLRLSRIVDYQVTHFGCAAEDLVRVFISTMSGKDRRENWERLLEEFHGVMQKHCFGELPFSLDQLKESYRRMFPIAGVLLLPVLDMVAKLGLSKLSEEEKTQKQIVLSEKTLALFEDILLFSKRNQDVRPNKNNSTAHHTEKLSLIFLSLGIGITVLYCLLRLLTI